MRLIRFKSLKVRRLEGKKIEETTVKLQTLKPSNFLTITLCVIIFTSACGMKRALTLPPEEKATKEVVKKIKKESKNKAE